MSEFAEWLSAVDQIIAQRLGVGESDLSDWQSRAAFDDDLTPAEGAEQCIEEQDPDVRETWEALR